MQLLDFGLVHPCIFFGGYCKSIGVVRHCRLAAPAIRRARQHRPENPETRVGQFYSLPERSVSLRSAAVLDFFEFIRAFVANPRQVSAIAPSGQTLARLMTQEIVPGAGPVIELGPGTGTFTNALIRRGVPERDLLLVEYGSDFVRLLQERFPRARVLWMDARQLSQYEPFMAPAAAVVSGLPLLPMSPRKVIAILSGAFRHMRDDGTFYQFTYGPR
ncbi:class I SAM-dependent methyltransferase, partial [Bradyrhizobium elkanii]|uniref:class I SAM-dependent methyltransferase n=1 Tax=Bradyrhizobium elkanii TaxID=29448 RepID=UPI0018AD34F1